MAKVHVKCFGVLRLDSRLEKAEIEAADITGLFLKVNDVIESELKIGYNDALVHVNGERCKSKRQKLNDGDEIWLLSPASGG